MSVSRENFEWVRNLLRREAAILLDESKTYLVETRLLPVAKKAGFPGIDELVEHLRWKPAPVLEQEVVEAMTTNETSFFRDVQPFEVLRREILPELFRRRAALRRLAIWSAGCASGQEPYSVAMLLHEHFGQYRDWKIELLASDISHAMLDRARRAVYSPLEIKRGLSPELQTRYFEPVPSGWQLVPQVRGMVQFRPLNLIGRWPPLPAMDVILLRNVLVYFDMESKRDILCKIRAVLRQDGYLFLGGAETTLHLDDAFQRVQRTGFSYYQLRSGA